MQKIISDLINEIRSASKYAYVEMKPSSFTPSSLEVMSFSDVAVPLTFETVTGLSISSFPPSEELSDEQMETLLMVLDETFSAFDYSVEVPERVPLALKYELYRDLFSGDHYLIPGYTCHFDFCSGYCPACKVAEFCDSRIVEGWD